VSHYIFRAEKLVNSKQNG